MNNKYYLISVSTGDEKVAGKGIYEFDTYNMAIANFHSKLGIAMKSELYETTLICVIDDNGMMIRSEKYTNPNYGIPVSEPTENPEQPTE